MSHEKRQELLKRKFLIEEDAARFKLTQEQMTIVPPLPGLEQRSMVPRKRRVEEILADEVPIRRSTRHRKLRDTEANDSTEDGEESELESSDPESCEKHSDFDSELGGANDAYESDDAALNNVTRDPQGAGCKSIPKGMSVEILTSVSRKTSFQANAATESGQIYLLGLFIKVDKKLQGFCRCHLSRLAGWLGFKTQGLSGERLSRRMLRFRQCGGDLVALKSNPETESWWRRSHRPVFEKDSLGVYSKKPVTNDQSFALSETHAMAIAESILPGSLAKFKDQGNIVLKDLFGYLWDGVTVDGEFEPGVGDLVDLEFDMYLHHQGERNGVSNKGWLRTMFYSLTQQTIRQDLGYWMIYAALRPDLNHHLVSYPYYAKYALPGDSTVFRHIDLNVNKYLETGREGEIIQGSISLDDENVDGCTELVLGFHKNMTPWWESIRSRGEVSDGWVTGPNKRYTKKDEEEFGEFVPVPCNRGDVRITRPEIPRGSTSPQKKIRRTILPWFTGLQADMERLDNEESDGWTDLSMHYITMTAPRYTPSGLENKYGPPPYKFPPATHLLLRSRVSCALVCRLPWSDHMVELEAPATSE